MSPRIALAVAVITITGPLTAQSLREQIRTDLFTFGNCGEPLCLAGALPGHGSHFIPATQSAAGDILDLLGNSLAASVANTPVGATSSGVTCQFVGGMPVKTATSGGTTFGERYWQGTSVATIMPAGYPSPHRFGGTDSMPVMTAVAGMDGSATGIGDVAARLKVNLAQSSAFGVSILMDARFPTGNENNLLGSGG